MKCQHNLVSNGDILQELPALNEGQVTVAGVSAYIPLLYRVETQHTPHSAEAKVASAERVDCLQLEEQARREHPVSLSVHPRRSGKSKMLK